MGINRRGFLKLAGITTLYGLGGGTIITQLAGYTTSAVAEGVTKDTLGKRLAMVIDLGKCAKKPGCKDCIIACHRVHNVPNIDDNPRHEIKWIWTESYMKAFPEQEHDLINDDMKRLRVPVLCNQCDNPPCTRVCPTRATIKRSDGIVIVDYHRCIGCRFCMAACPYGARSFNWRDPSPSIKDVYPKFPTRTTGVVEKCNFCADRLGEGLVPACVEKCPQKAMFFGELGVSGSHVRRLLRSRYSIRRKPGLGTKPEVYYLV